MAEHNEIGKQGEILAQQYITTAGYKIIATNWRKHRCEVDIIALHHHFLCFVEVKTRTHSMAGNPRDAVNRNKQQELIKAANLFLEEFPEDYEVRFDVVEIILNLGNQPKINIIQDAFNAVS